MKLVQIELNGYTKCSPESAQERERVKEVTEEGFFVAFDLTVGAKEESSVTSELNRAELVTQGKVGIELRSFSAMK